MGSGSYSSEAYSEASRSRGYSHKSTHELFRNTIKADVSNLASSFNTSARVNNTNVKPEMLNAGVRESRDSAEHPHTTPIIIALDVTGSMYDTPEHMIKEQFPKLMEKLEQLGVQDPQLLFMAIGDHECDSYPIQTGQFESDTNKILDSLQSFYLEGGGGPNYGESYLLAWIIAGYHTEIDSFYKRGRKGYLFTVGDEPCLEEIMGDKLEKFLKYQKGASMITAEEALEKAREQYNIWHVHISDASKRLKRDAWEKLVGKDNLLESKSDEIANTIARTIGKFYTPESDSSNVETKSETTPEKEKEHEPEIL